MAATAPPKEDHRQKKIRILEEQVAAQAARITELSTSTDAGKAIAERDEAREVARELKLEIDSYEEQIRVKDEQLALLEGGGSRVAAGPDGLPLPEHETGNELGWKPLPTAPTILFVTTHTPDGVPTGYAPPNSFEYRERASFGQSNSWSQTSIEGRASSAVKRALGYNVKEGMNRLGCFHEHNREGCTSLPVFPMARRDEAYLETIVRIVWPGE